MSNFIFKTYITDGREYYEYTADGEQTIKRLPVSGKSDELTVYGYLGA